ncbi:MAG: dephospho-CoA kinase [Verrucomicrobia bacterium]|nr:dephospho-CoA kinase [Verrucomicrobiota bacterium]
MFVGITGGIGCGKSTAARCFERRGFRRLDSDGLVREQILTAPEVVAAIRSKFGDEVLEAAGGRDAPRISRPALGARVFSDDAHRRWLEELTHPRVFGLWRDAFDAAPAGTRWAVEVPLLFEKQLENWFDFTVCVACAPECQLARLEQRGLPRVLAGQRISTQLPLARKVELADHVLWNDGTPEFLEAQVTRLIEVLNRGA